MDQESAFLQAIVEAPDDDVPRLVYADWLDDQGTRAAADRADFIRVQFALRDLPLTDPTRAQLEERQRDLLIAHEQEWVAPLRRAGMVRGWEFRRGFVERITLTPEQLLEQVDVFFRLAPIQAVRLEGGWWGSPKWDRVRKVPQLERLTEIDLTPLFGETDAALAALVQCAGLTRLRSLRSGWQMPPWDALARAPWLAQLTSLSLSGHGGGPGAAAFFRSAPLNMLDRLELIGEGSLDLLEPLVGSPHVANVTSLCFASSRLRDPLERLAAARFPRLTTLDLSDNALAGPAAHVLAGLALLDTVEDLRLARNALRGDGVRALVRSPHLGRLVRLNLSANSLGLEDARALAEADTMPRLSVLALRANRLGDEGMKALAPLVARLSELSVNYNKVGASGVLGLTEAAASSLRRLDLSWNTLGTGVESLAAWPGLAELTGLDLGYAELGDRAARALAASPYLARLRSLNLGTNRIGDDGARALAGSPHLTELTSLNLGNNQVGENGARALLAAPLFKRLAFLHLSGNAVPPGVMAELRSEFRGILGG
jgi:uncharacterized protein (TIGR02996 family)